MTEAWFSEGFDISLLRWQRRNQEKSRNEKNRDATFKIL